MRKRKVLAIVGAGASGTILTAHLASGLKQPTDIYLLERSGVFGPGLAYNLDEPCFLLNVRAGRMGAHADKPAHFFEWMQNHQSQWRDLHAEFSDVLYGVNDFVPRMIYGAYLKWILDDAKKTAQQNGHRVFLLAETVVRISQEESELKIETEEGCILKADSIVFASGNASMRSMAKASERIFDAPYENRFLEMDLSKTNHILIVGTGLSMVDTLQILKDRRFKGQVTALSRHGLLPFPHPKESKTVQSVFAEQKVLRVSDVVNVVRKQMKEFDWQDRIDSLRSDSEKFWQSLTSQHQKSLSRVFPWWSIARHRIPDFIHDDIEKLKEKKKLRVLKGSISEVSDHSDGVRITLKNGENIEGDILVSCAGFSYAAENVQKLCPEIKLEKHWRGGLAPASGQKFRVSEQHPVFAIGPLLYGWNFESTAVHEIRTHAAQLVEDIET